MEANNAAPEKPRILFVDDEELILKGIRRMLASKRKDWDMFFVDSGEGALAFLAEKECDVIVTDLLMPGMDGHQLLKRVQHAFPGVKRIVLTGQPDRELKSDIVFPAHQYLMKPCDFETMTEVLNEVLALESLRLESGLKEIISKIETLPAIPEIYSRIRKELQQEEPSIKSISELIAQDVALSSKLISIVNSPYYGNYSITDPKQAVITLGFNMVHSLVLTVQAFSLYDPKKVPGFSISMLWEHSKRVACLAKHIALSEGRREFDANHAFLAGLLHDVGKLVLATSFPEKYNQVLSTLQKEDKTVFEVEDDIFGASHAKVGAYLMGLWGIPANVTKAIAYHHTPLSVSEKSSPLFELYIANVVDHAHVTINPHYKLNKKYADKLVEFGLKDKVEAWKEASEKSLEEKDSC